MVIMYGGYPDGQVINHDNAVFNLVLGVVTLYFFNIQYNLCFYKAYHGNAK